MTPNETDKALRAISKARAKLILENPFFAALALRLEVIPTLRVSTAGVDGRHLFICPEWINKQKPEHLVTIVAHEAMHCFPAGTIVAGDFQTIEKYETGMAVIDQGGEHTRIVSTGRRHYSGPMVTIKARGMLPVQATSEHPFLVRRPRWRTKDKPTRHNIREWSAPMWVAAKELRAGDWLHVPRIKGDRSESISIQIAGNPWSVPVQQHHPIPFDEEVAEFLGWYVAEGWATLTKPGNYLCGLALGPSEYPVALRLQDILKRRFGIAARIQTRQESGFEVKFSSRGFGRWLRENCGHGARAKRMPEQILYHADEGVLRAFLRAYIAGDGNIAVAISYASASRPLALQIQAAFARLGALINLYRRPPSTGQIGGNRPYQSGPIYHGATRSILAFEALGVEHHAKRPTLFASTMQDAILTPIVAVTCEQWEGEVFNLETEAHTYTAGNIVTHNCALHHTTRRGARNPAKANIAMDHAINLILKDAGLPMPSHATMDAKFKGMAWEQIYNLLPDQPPKAGRGKAQGGGGDDDPLPDYGGMGCVIDAQGDDGKPLSEAERDALEREWKVALLQAAQTAKAQGRLPGGLEELIEATRTPQVDWRAVLREFVRTASRNDFSWRKPNYRFLAAGDYLPSLYDETVGPIAMGVDTSGSVSQAELDAACSELNACLDTARPESVDVVYCDAKVAHHETFAPDDWPVKMTARGRGGTDLRGIWPFLSGKDINPVCAILTTDMELCVADLGEEPPYPVLVLCTSGRDAPMDGPLPFGTLVKVEVG